MDGEQEKRTAGWLMLISVALSTDSLRCPASDLPVHQLETAFCSGSYIPAKWIKICLRVLLSDHRDGVPVNSINTFFLSQIFIFRVQ